MSKITKVFLASSSEPLAGRREFETLINRKNKLIVRNGEILIPDQKLKYDF